MGRDLVDECGEVRKDSPAAESETLRMGSTGRAFL